MTEASPEPAFLPIDSNFNSTDSEMMEKPLNHQKEVDRLQSLQRLQILDSSPEHDFDEIALIASQIFECPIALVSFVDENRQWFKATLGLQVSETSRDISFCGHAILNDNVFVIEDTHLDPRFSDNPLVTGEPAIRFYAGAPLKDPLTGLPLGTVCVIDSKPRVITEKQISMLRALSNQASRLLELREMLNTLKISEAKMVFQNAVFENMTEGVVLQGSDGRILEFNEAAVKVLGLTHDQLLGKSSLDPDWHAVHEDLSAFPGEEHPAMRALFTGEPQKNIAMGIQTKDNEPRWLSINSVPIFLNKGEKPTHAVTTFSDVSQERKTRQKLLQTAKLTSLGEMAAGIAHEINTPLAVITASAHQGRVALSNNQVEVANQKLNKIETTAFRIAQIVRGLRTFSRDGAKDPLGVVSIDQLVHESVALCSDKFRAEGIELKLLIEKEVQALASGAQLSQAIVNLLNNAFDAVRNMEKKWVQMTLTSNLQLITLEVMDCGHGISEELQEKIMQPFFSTKEVGHGTGLGLSISKGIIESFGGQLFYKSTSPHTCFVIELPALPDRKSENNS